MAEPSPVLLAAIRAIDAFTTWCGQLVAWLILPLVAAVTYEVVARHLFHAPTIWSYDLTCMLYGTLFMLGAAYALRRGAHIRTDMFWENYSVRTKGLVDATAYLLFFFPAFCSSCSPAGTRPTTPGRSARSRSRPPGARSSTRSRRSCRSRPSC